MVTHFIRRAPSKCRTSQQAARVPHKRQSNTCARATRAEGAAAADLEDELHQERTERVAFEPLDICGSLPRDMLSSHARPHHMPLKLFGSDTLSGPAQEADELRQSIGSLESAIDLAMW